MATESNPRPTKTVRHDATVTTHASGAPAMTAPKLPANCTTPTSVAKRLAGNHTADIFNSEMKATETPMPTSVRPIAATSHEGAKPNSSDPAPAISAPTVTMRRGPSVSAITPTGICSSV